MASPAVATMVSGTRAQATLTASEPGTVDLDRLVVSCASRTALANGEQCDLLPITRITSLLMFNSEELIRGRVSSGDLGAPAGVFSAQRQYNALRLGRRRLGSGDTIDLFALFEATGLSKALLSFAVPFLPDRFQGDDGDLPDPDTAAVYACTPDAAVIVGSTGDLPGTGDITITFDQDGVFDLDSLQMLVSANPCANWFQMAQPAVVITKMTLPSGDALLIGKNSPGAPAMVFHHIGRPQPFVHLGEIRVASSDALTISLANYGPATTANDVIVTAGGLFRPARRTS